MPEDLPDDVCRLLLDDIRSYEQLEIMLLLRNHPGEEWTRDRVGEHLGIDATSAGNALEHLCRRDILEQRANGTQYRYGPRRPELAATVARLVAAYADERRLKVMKSMNANAMQRLRNNAVRAFADAFVVGKDKKDG